MIVIAQHIIDNILWRESTQGWVNDEREHEKVIIIILKWYESDQRIAMKTM